MQYAPNAKNGQQKDQKVSESPDVVEPYQLQYNKAVH